MRTRTRDWLTITFVALGWAVSLRVTILACCFVHDRPLLPWERPDPALQWEPDIAVLLSDAETELRFRIAQTDRDFKLEGFAWQTAKQKWEAANLGDYELVLAYACFCGRAHQHPRKVVVRDGRVDRVEYVDVPGVDTPDVAPEGMTVEEAFDKVWSTHRSSVDSLTVHYDPVYGFPMTLSVDEEAEALDDEWSMTIRKFRVRELRLGVGRANRDPASGTAVVGTAAGHQIR